jgi:WD40 repeat protein
MQIFTGGEDGYWRLWNTQNLAFAKTAENHQKGPVECLKVVSNFLFCAFEAPATGLPSSKAGQVQAWNLANPTAPPLEFHIAPGAFPYAHNLRVTALEIVENPAATAPPTTPGAPPVTPPPAATSPRIVTGGADGVIRLWAMQGNTFVVEKTFPGHAGEITGLVMVNNILWSCSQDGSIRIWDVNQMDTTAALQHTIVGTETSGHTGPVLALVPLVMNGQTYIISGSVDSHIKVWDSSNGQLMADQNQGEGIMSLAVSTTEGGTPVLLIGTTKGSIACRTINQTNKLQAFQLVFTLNTHQNTAGHRGPVTSLVGGLQGVFYSTGKDGQVMAWQLPSAFERLIN